MNDQVQGLATILAIGTANPFNCIYRTDYPDYYFRVTNSEEKTMLKDKFKRICEKSMITKRYMHLTEKVLEDNPNMCSYAAPSLDARQDIKIVEIPKLGERAAMTAIKEWGQPKSNITHLIFCTTSGADMPGAEFQLIKSLGLKPTVKRVMLYHQGCFAGGTVLRIAKDLAENNAGARVLVVCSEITVSTFRGPSEDDMACLVGQAIFGDGAAAVVIGADDHKLLPDETPLFRLVSASQTIIPSSEGAIEGRVREVGLTFHLSHKVPKVIGENIEKYLEDVFGPFGISDWNSLFWAPHPGGAAILRETEGRVGLGKEKLRATWHVLSEYGNMSSACVFFILDEMRKKSFEEGKGSSGEFCLGLDLGSRWRPLFCRVSLIVEEN